MPRKISSTKDKPHNYHWVCAPGLMKRLQAYCESSGVKSVSSVIAISVDRLLKQEGF